MQKIQIENGTIFNDWTVIRQATEEQKKQLSNVNGTQYLCKCVCGIQKFVPSRNLRNNRSAGCGCKRYQRIAEKNKKDLTGKRFGILTILECAGTYKDLKPETHCTGFAWKCQCDCGNICYKSYGHLINGNSKSCGCVKSFGEQQIAKILNDYGINFISQYSFDDLRSSNGGKLLFDFAIFKNNKTYLIEYNGVQHYQNYGQFGKLQREETDKLKQEYCKNNNILLFEIGFFENINKKLEEFKEIIEL